MSSSPSKPPSSSSVGGNGALIGGLLAAGVAIAGAVGYRLLAKREEASTSAASTPAKQRKVLSPVKKTVPRRTPSAVPAEASGAAAPATVAATPAQPRQARCFLLPSTLLAGWHEAEAVGSQSSCAKGGMHGSHSLG